MIISLCGKLRSGKDSVAKTLASKHGFIHLSFAAPLKKFCKDYLGLTEEESSDENKDKPIQRYGYRTARQVWQDVGEFTRSIYPKVWVDKVFNGLDLTYDYVISDVRFKNELEEVLKFNGLVVHVVRPTFHLSSPPGHNHVSETELSNVILYDYKILNDDGIDALEAKVDKLAEYVRKNKTNEYV